MSELASVQKDIMRKAIASMVFAAETLEQCANPTELLECALQMEHASTHQKVSYVGEIFANASLKQMLKSSSSSSYSASPPSASPPSAKQDSPPASPTTIKTFVTTKKTLIGELPLPYETFAQFACECEGAPLTLEEYVVPDEMYDSSSYRRRVEKKDPTKPKWADFKEAQQEALAAKGACFDKDDFFAKATMLSSKKRKSALWTKYKITCGMLMGLKMFEHSTHVVGEKRSAPAAAMKAAPEPKKRAGMSAKASEALEKVRPPAKADESDDEEREMISMSLDGSSSSGEEDSSSDDEEE
jgi:hypothetical protein